MSDMTPQVYAAHKDQMQRFRLMVELEYALGPVRFCTGVGQVSWQGAIWTGAGHLARVSQIKSSADGSATGMAFGLAGMPLMYGDLNVAAYVDQFTRMGGYANCWIAHFNITTGVLLPEPKQLMRGKMDAPVINLARQTFEVTVSVETARARLQKRQGIRLTDETQRSFYPDDRGFEYIAALQNKSLT